MYSLQANEVRASLGTVCMFTGALKWMGACSLRVPLELLIYFGPFVHSDEVEHTSNVQQLLLIWVQPTTYWVTRPNNLSTSQPTAVGDFVNSLLTRLVLALALSVKVWTREVINILAKVSSFKLMGKL